MGALKIQWTRRAQVHFDTISTWYAMNMGTSAAKKFSFDVRKTIDVVSQYPKAGTRDAVYSKYYSFLIHTRYRLVYRFTQTTLYVMAIRSTQKKYN